MIDVARLPQGRIHANGRGFVPYIRKDLYAKIVARVHPELIEDGSVPLPATTILPLV